MSEGDENTVEHDQETKVCSWDTDEQTFHHVIPLPGDSEILVGSMDTDNRGPSIFSTATGNCEWTFQSEGNRFLPGHNKDNNDRIAGLALLDEFTFVSLSWGGTARVWSMRSHKLLHVSVLPGNPVAIASLSNCRAVVRKESGSLYLMDWTGKTLKTHLESNDKDSETAMLVTPTIFANVSISVFQSHCAIMSSNERVSVWAVQMPRPTLELVANVKDYEDGKTPTYVSIRGSNMIVSASDSHVYVYDVQTFTLQRKFDLNKIMHCIELVGDGEHFICTAFDKFIFLYCTTTGQLLWKWGGKPELSHPVALTAVPFGPIVITSHYKSFLVTPPPEIALLLASRSAVEEIGIVTFPPLPPLQSALTSVLRGESSPADHCKSLITADACAVSLAEWHSAHQLLMLAIGDSDIMGSIDFDGKPSWWFLQLYSVARALQFESEDDVNIVQRCLREAKGAGVIETIEAALGVAILANEIRSEVRRLHQAGIMICQRVLCNEGKLNNLEESFLRYRNVQRVSQLAGIALQLIPIAGGAAAGVFSAGAEIIDGLSVKDVADYAFGFSADQVSEQDVQSFPDRVFRRAGTVIRPEALDRLAQSKRGELIRCIESCGLKAEELRGLFDRQITSDTTGHNAEPLADTAVPEHEVVVPPDFEEFINSQDCEGPIEDPRAIQHAPQRTESAMEREEIAFTSTGINRAVLERSTRKELARMWSEHILRSYEESVLLGSYTEIISAALSRNHLSGRSLVIAKCISAEQLASMVVGELEKSEHLDFSIGRRIWAEDFASIIHIACHGEADP